MKTIKKIIEYFRSIFSRADNDVDLEPELSAVVTPPQEIDLERLDAELTYKDSLIYGHLRYRNRWVSPKEVGRWYLDFMDMKIPAKTSSYANRSLIKLVKLGLAERNEQGLYRFK
jgi:hypothetical protein